MAGWSKRAVLDAAQRGLTTATARYSAVQVMMLLGGCFACLLHICCFHTLCERCRKNVVLWVQSVCEMPLT